MTPPLPRAARAAPRLPRALPRAAALAAALALLPGLAACGPVRSTAYLLDAEVQIQAARTTGAERLAPYEWTGANLYLQKAREEVGYSDYEVAVRFAERAAKLAAAARTKAMAAKGEQPAGAPPEAP